MCLLLLVFSYEAEGHLAACGCQWQGVVTAGEAKHVGWCAVK